MLSGFFVVVFHIRSICKRCADEEEAVVWIWYRGVKDIFILCADGLSGIKETIAAAYPNMEYQPCIVHVVRNTLKFVSHKDMKAFATDLKTIYHAPDDEQGYKRMEQVRAVWEKKYPGAMSRWSDN